MSQKGAAEYFFDKNFSKTQCELSLNVLNMRLKFTFAIYWTLPYWQGRLNQFCDSTCLWASTLDSLFLFEMPNFAEDYYYETVLKCTLMWFLTHCLVDSINWVFCYAILLEIDHTVKELFDHYWVWSILFILVTFEDESFVN